MILIISATLRNPAARRLLRLTPNYSAAPATGSKALRIQVRAAIDDVKAAAAVPAKPKPGVGPFVERLAEQVSTPFRRKKAEPPASITYPKVDRAQPKPRAKRSKAAIMEAEDYEERRQQDMRALMSMRQQHTKPAGQDKFL